MYINRIHFIAFLLPLLLWSCDDPNEHDHGTDEAVHSHGAGNGLTTDTTIRQGAVELFVEYPALIVGKKSRFAAHFTRLRDHRAVGSGTVTVSLIKGKQGIRHRVDSPSSPGIFRPALLPKETGSYVLRFDIRSPELDWNQFIEWKTRVFPDEASAKQFLSNSSSPKGDISFTKEQAWKIDFKTMEVQFDTVYNTIQAPGRWMPAPKMERTMTAGAEGNVLFLASDLVEGRGVHKGQSLMLISGEGLNTRSIQSEIDKAKASLEQARKEYERKKELFDLEVVPASEFEQVEKQYEIAKSEYRQLIKNYGGGGVQVQAPFSGYIKKMHIDNGAFAGIGKPLFTMGSDRSDMIRIYMDPDERYKIRQIQRIWIPYEEEGRSQLAEGEVVSVGQKVSREEPLLPVIIRAESPAHGIEGSLTEVQLAYGSGRGVPVVPRSALLEDFGSYSVVVQVSGESYEIRPVKTGARNGRSVAIEEGLAPGDWIVSEGAYQVKMASMKGTTPAHGHTH